MQRKLALINIALIVNLLLSAAVGIIPLKAANSYPPMKITNFKLPVHKVRGLDSNLVELVEGQEKGQLATVAHKLNIDVKDNKVGVVIEAKPGKSAAVLALAKSLGADSEIIHKNFTQVKMPVTSLMALTAASDSIREVRRLSRINI
jgi:hypothetical protein